MSIVTLEDKTNGLLKRREIRCLFKGFAGRLTRKESAEMLAKELGLERKFVIPLHLDCKTGTNEVNCVFYIYDDENLARRHLPKYVFLRMLTKEERKKAREAEKAKGKKPAEGAPEKKEAPKEKEPVETDKAESKEEKPKAAKSKERPVEEAKG